MNTRTYQGLSDLESMLNLLSKGCKADNGTYYVHRGDVQWWLFYNDDPPEGWKSQIHLWFEADDLIGWALLSPNEDAFDVFTLPDLRGTVRERAMLGWAVDQMASLDELNNVWVGDGDEVRIRWFEDNGFTPQLNHFVHFQRSLARPVDEFPLPEGFSIRSSRGTEEDARLRAACSHAAFQSGKPFEDYWRRTLRLMQSPVYVPEHEIFVMSPENEVAAFCIVWTDDLNKLGHFEPVATHPKFQRRGLGKSLLYEGLHRLKSEGMNEADVCAVHDNEAAIRLYESVGFRKSKRLLTYRKRGKHEHNV